MDEKEQSNFEHITQKRLLHSAKLKLIGAKLEGYESSNGVQLKAESLASDLFARAQQFVDTNSVDKLSALARRAYEVVFEHHTNKASLSIVTELKTNKEEGSYSSFYVVMRDRPFIVNTISECIQEAGLNLDIYLHPIITLGDQKVSLSYLETNALSPEKSYLLEKRLRSCLEDLILVTDDFGEMLEQSKALAVRMNSVLKGSAELTEVKDFVEWLCDGSLVFLGLGIGDKAKLDKTYGLLRAKLPYHQSLNEELIEDIKRTKSFISISKLRTLSSVHRRTRLTNIVLNNVDGSGSCLCIIGLLTSKALLQESSSIPIIRQKLQKILIQEEALPNSYLYKKISNIIDSTPKDEAFRLSDEELHTDVSVIIGLQNPNQTRVSIHFDSSKRGVSVMVVLPKERFSSNLREKVQVHLERFFGAAAGSSDHHIVVTNKLSARAYFYVPLADADFPQVDLKLLELGIVGLTKSWEDNLKECIFDSSFFGDPDAIWLKYAHAFSSDYQALHSPVEAELDINAIESLDGTGTIKIAYAPPRAKDQDSFTLIAYQVLSEITLSRALPILENSGLEVISESCSVVRPKTGKEVFVHRFIVRPKVKTNIENRDLNALFVQELSKIFCDQAANDRLNSLVLSAGLDCRAIALLRSYCALFWQVNKFATRHVIFEAFSENADNAKLLWSCFELKFSPQIKLTKEERLQKVAEQLEKYRSALHDVKDLSHDRVLRAIAMLFEHTVRSNFFSQNAPAIALKVNSKNVEIIPQPRPLYEIFVYGTSMEGVHLRSGQVARGGIRASDRREDYRTEVLGLMKTQSIKNSVIVPRGAKGGFVVKRQAENREQAMRESQDAYRTFIRSLLSLSDNVVDGRVVHPSDLIIYDGEDPYLVVAADKGTATFSDVANKIAVEEFKFWLGDAFASGGSNGYDHKVYGITAKGAWECVKRHFHEIGIDYQSTSFSAIGIGDMSGDVFGNGLLLSENYKLIAAFNHKHIFLDPQPDPAKSFAERKRLFQLPTSEWKDYNPALISNGGGVFARFDKEIKLSSAAKQALGIAAEAGDVFNGEQLIAHILRAPCDLLWNGGIGTYVKSRHESHADVNDSTNDSVRVNADELRTKVVAEGGNLGFTQKARVEFASLGGRINTDAIDNSGGVDLSDHEVNLKIFLDPLVREGSLSRDERNKLLHKMADDACSLVLEHNRSQALALSIAVRRSQMNIEYIRNFLSDLAKWGYVNRNLDALPDEEQINDRARRKLGFTRPELAICLSGTKMWLKDNLLASQILEEPILLDFLLKYFPVSLQNKFKERLALHSLSKNIIATEVTNTLIDKVGISFLHRISTLHKVPVHVVIRALIACYYILDSELVESQFKKFDNVNGNDKFIELYLELGNSLRDACTWFLTNQLLDQSISDIVSSYRESYRHLLLEAEVLLPTQLRQQFQQRCDGYAKLGIEVKAARHMAMFSENSNLLEVIRLSRQSGFNLETCFKVFSQVIEDLGVGFIFQLERTLQTANRWENDLKVQSCLEVRQALSLIALNLLKKSLHETQKASQALKSSESFEVLKNTLADFKLNTNIIAALPVIAKQLKRFVL